MPGKCKAQGANEADDSGDTRGHFSRHLCRRIFGAQGNSAREGSRRGTCQARSDIRKHL